jgi:hypothetical protein
MSNQSEVAQLRERIALECQAGWWGLKALASGTAQHEFIHARFQNMETYHQRLTELVGEKKATDVRYEVYDAEGKKQ